MMNASIAAERPRRLGVGITRRRNPSPLPWLVPLILVLGIFYLYPLIDVFRLAFTNVSLVGADEAVHVADSSSTRCRGPSSSRSFG